MNINSSQNASFVQYLNAIIRHKEFILFLTKRNISIHFKRTQLGVFWVFLNPLINIFIYLLFFKYFMEVQWAGNSYLLYLFSGFCIWNLFSSISIQGGHSIIENQNIIKKNAMPRISFNLAKGMQNIVEQSSFILLVTLTIFIVNKPFAINIILLPISIFLTIVFAFSNSLFFSYMSLRKRDILQALPFIFQISIWFTPVFYPVNILPEKIQNLMYFNPIFGLLEMYRFSLNIDATLSPFVILSTISIITYLLITFILFKNSDKWIADYF